MKIGICGYYAFGNKLLNGQTIKTKTFTNALKDTLGKENVMSVDTHSWRKKPIKLIFECINLMKKNDNILIFPAHNGIKVFPLLFVTLNKFFNKKLQYIVIGGWLSEKLENNARLTKTISKFDGVYVETETMKSSLNKLGLDNIKVLKNFKEINILEKEEIVTSHKKPFKLCTFSRVMEEKGIEDAINVIQEINELRGEIVFTLDIYGQIEKGYHERFTKIMKNTPSYIKYLGKVDYNESVKVLKKYFLLLFPTNFYTEGIPGTIIDAYAAGIPTVVSNWESSKEIVSDGETGYIYKFGDKEDLKRTLLKSISNIEHNYEMKLNCLEQAKQYIPNNVIDVFIQYL